MGSYRWSSLCNDSVRSAQWRSWTGGDKAGGKIENANKLLLYFIIIGWGIYPLGYLIGTADGQWYQFLNNLISDSGRDLVYNIGDAINKIGFGLVIWSVARSEK